MKKTILITGGAGAIGSNMCRKYIHEGHGVICVDNLQKTRTTVNIDDLLNHENFRFIKHDIIESISIDEDLDWVVNMACPVSCIDLQVDPIHTVRSNVEGVINMLDLARKHDAVFLQASSADIYGEKTDAVQTEADWGSVNTLSPRACYEEGKRVAETLCMDHHRQHGTRVKIARIFNTSGPGTHISDGRVISNFIFAALDERDLHIYGDGSATRCFLYMDDQLDALDRFLKADDNITGPINIGNNEEVTMKQLAETIIDLTDSNSKIVYEKRDDAPLFRKPDIQKAFDLLGWKPMTSLEDNLLATINYYKKVGLPDQNILVFATTYYPDMGPAERALAELVEGMHKSHFHIVTTKFRKNLSSVEQIGNATVYRVGFGNAFDKFLLPLAGLFKGGHLFRKYKFRYIWSIMASYGSFAAMILKKLNPRSSILLLRDKTELSNEGNSSLKSYIVKKADQVYDNDDEHDSINSDFLTTVKEDYALLLAKQEGKLEKHI